MAKTYILTATAKGGRRGHSSNTSYSMYSVSDLRSGYSGSYDYATYYMFDTATLAALRSKTVTSVRLTVSISGVPSSSSSQNHQLCYKSNNTAGSSSSNAAWATGSRICWVNSGTYASGTFTIGTSASAVPAYGFVFGPYEALQIKGEYITLGSTATLTVVTNETDYTYTLSYNANGGTGAPANQTGSNTRTSPSYTFTLSDTVPTRTGYTFAGWSTTSGGQAAYQPGDTYTVSSTSATLYAVWTKNSYTVNVQCIDPENEVSQTAALFDVWYSDDSTVYADNTSLSVSKKYGDTIYISNIRPYYAYFEIESVTGAVSDGGGQYHYTLDENAEGYLISINTSRAEYAVTYDANGGTGAPASQTKYGGVSLTLSTSIPTRAGFTFVKWNTASDGTGVDYNPGAPYTTNAALQLYAIWVASSSTITLANYICESGSSVMIYINKISPTATHTLTYSLGNQSGVIVTKTLADEVTWTVPIELISDIPGETGTCLIYCTTYIDNAQTGVPQEAELVVSVPSSYQPMVGILVTKVNQNNIVDNWDILLQGYSQVEVRATSVMASGATVESYSFSGPGVSYVGPNAYVLSNVIDVYGQIPWTVTVTDSRGRTATATWDDPDFEIFAYSNPSISNAVTMRTDATGVSATGEFLKSKARLTISSANGNNAITVHKVEYKEIDDSTWTLGDDTMVSDTWTNPYGGGTIDIVNRYDIRYTLTDSLGNTVQVTSSVLSVTGIGIGLKNDRIRLGGLPTKPGLQVDWDAEFNGKTTINGATIITDSIANGGSKTYSLSDNEKVLFVLLGHNEPNKCLLLVNTTAAGVVSYLKTPSTASNISVTNGTRSITIASATNGVTVLAFKF